VMTSEPPQWVTILGWSATGLGLIVLTLIVTDIYLRGHRQSSPAMGVIWPLTAIYAGPLALWMYYRWGRQSTAQRQQKTQAPPPGPHATAAVQCLPGAAASFVAHLLVMPLVMWTGVTIAGRSIWPMILLIVVFALPLLTAFEYQSLQSAPPQPRHRRLLTAAVISTLAIIAFDLGMGAAMLLVGFKLNYAPTSIAFWLVMWGGMLLGGITAYPVMSWWVSRQAKGSQSAAGDVLQTAS
jgi:hypothetical protein